MDQKTLRARRWVIQKRGTLKDIANEFGVSIQFVSQVLYGRSKSKDGRVEMKLRKMGAPVKG